MYRSALISALFLSASVLLGASTAHAQFSIASAESAVSISLSPAYPGPNTPVNLTVQSGLYDVSQGTVTWTVNGKVIAQGTGATARITTGGLGSETRVRVDVSTDTGDASTALTIVPASVDLLWESNSYTPPFYRGRGLPSAGSTITIVAIPHVARAGGAALAADQLIYTWKKDGAVVASASGKGRSSATFASPMLYGVSSISVVAASADGAVAAQGILRIGDTEPRLALYEDDPLFGILYHKALGSAFIPETEMSFVAIPYFAPSLSLNNSQLEYAWTVNGNPVSIAAAKPNEITINAAKSSGIAAIALQLTHASNYFLNVAGAWNISFSNAANGSGGGTVDPFHR